MGLEIAWLYIAKLNNIAFIRIGLFLRRALLVDPSPPGAEAPP